MNPELTDTNIPCICQDFGQQTRAYWSKGAPSSLHSHCHHYYHHLTLIAGPACFTVLFTDGFDGFDGFRWFPMVSDGFVTLTQ